MCAVGGRRMEGGALAPAAAAVAAVTSTVASVAHHALLRAAVMNILLGAGTSVTRLCGHDLNTCCSVCIPALVATNMLFFNCFGMMMKDDGSFSFLFWKDQKVTSCPRFSRCLLQCNAGARGG